MCELCDAVLQGPCQFCGCQITVSPISRCCEGSDRLAEIIDGFSRGYGWPFPGAGHYRGHLEGLYLCGSCCHPSGNVTGLPGYNAAQVLLGDLGLRAEFGYD